MFEYLTMSQAARVCSCKPSTIRYWVDTNRLTAHQAGGVWLVRIQEVREANEKSLRSNQRKFSGRRKKAS